MRFPWQRIEPDPNDLAQHIAQQDVRVKEAQAIISETRDHSNKELKRASGILDEVRSSEKKLANMFDEADQELRGT